MYIRTKENRLFNVDRVDYFEITPYLNCDKANIDAYLPEGHFVLFTGTCAETKKAFQDLLDALSSNRLTIFDFTSR